MSSNLDSKLAINLTGQSAHNQNTHADSIATMIQISIYVYLVYDDKKGEKFT
jgi:hypothetical protein